MVPMLTCGFVRSNFAFATVDPFPSGTVPVFWSGWLDCVVKLVGVYSLSGVLRELLRMVSGVGPGVLHTIARFGVAPFLGSLRTCDAYSPVAFAMISLATFGGTSA